MWIVFIITFVSVAIIESALSAFTPIFRGIKNPDPFKMSPLEMKIVTGEATLKEKASYFLFGVISSPFNFLIYIIAGVITFIISFFV